MAESISIPCFHIQKLIVKKAPSEVTSALEKLKCMLLKIQWANDRRLLSLENFNKGQYEHLNNDIRNFSYEIDTHLDTIHIIMESLKRWTENNDISNLFKTLAITYNKARVLHNIRSLIDLVQKSNFNGCQNENVLLEVSEPSFYPHAKYHYLYFDFYNRHFSNYVENLLSNMSNISFLKRLILLKEKFVNINTLEFYVNVERIYHNINIRKSFQAFAWVSIAKHSKKVNIYGDILKQLFLNDKKNDAIGLQYMDDEELCRELSQALRSYKCLIVFTVDHGVNIEDIIDPFKFSMESMVLFTTDWGDKFTDEEGLKLLEEMTFPIGETGKEIVKECNGVPHQIARIGLFMREHNSDHDLNKMLRFLKNSPSNWNIVALSYDQLSIDLKALFLYFGQFWEGEDINVEMLYQMWIAEGLVMPHTQKQKLLPQESKSAMDMAEDILDILAMKYLIDIQKHEFSITRKFVSCRIDRFVKEFCLRPNRVFDIDSQVVKETEYSFESTSQDGCRLSLKFDEYQPANIDTELIHILLRASKELRFLLIENKNRVSTIQISFPSKIYKKFKLLRVLKIKNIEIRGWNLPKDLRSLVHLRFLSLEGSTIEELPKTLGNLPFLETLDLRVAEIIPKGIIIPNVLWKLKKLRHLYLPTLYQLLESKEKLLLGGLNNLETLINLDIPKTELTSLEWKSLRQIDAVVHGKKNIRDLITCINSGENLKDVFFRVNFSNSSYEESDVTLEDVSNCSKLNHFTVTWGRWDLINEFKTPCPFSSNVIELCLTRCHIREDPMPIIGKFPILKKFVLGKKSFMGICMLFQEKSFPTLRYLKIEGLIHVEELMICDYCMPHLFCFEIIRCLKLKMIPNGMKFIKRLSELKLNMPKEFNDNIRPGDKSRSEEVNKVQHVPFIFFEDL